jgi:hypothetical protein
MKRDFWRNAIIDVDLFGLLWSRTVFLIRISLIAEHIYKDHNKLKSITMSTFLIEFALPMAWYVVYGRSWMILWCPSSLCRPIVQGYARKYVLFHVVHLLNWTVLFMGIRLILIRGHGRMKKADSTFLFSSPGFGRSTGRDWKARIDWRKGNCSCVRSTVLAENTRCHIYFTGCEPDASYVICWRK